MNARPRHQLSLPAGDYAHIVPLLRHAGRDGVDLLRSLRSLSGWGIGMSHPAMQKSLALQWRSDADGAMGAPLAGDVPRIGIVLHLHYAELWEEFEAALGAIDLPFVLIVSLSGEAVALSARILAAFPQARLFRFDNRGRDVGPFLELLRQGALDGFDLVCKLHGKRSGLSGPRALFGAIWRWTLLRELIGSAATVRRIVAAMAADPSIGLVGPGAYRLPNRHVGDAGAWGSNRPRIETLAGRLGLAPEAIRLDFIAGTMFWIRREALDRLRRLDLGVEDFAPEQGRLDGGLEHAMERLFGVATVAAGYRIVSAETLPAPGDRRGGD